MGLIGGHEGSLRLEFSGKLIAIRVKPSGNFDFSLPVN